MFDMLTVERVLIVLIVHHAGKTNFETKPTSIQERNNGIPITDAIFAGHMFEIPETDRPVVMRRST